MPELPEVETIARGLAQNLTGDVIESVWLGNKPEPLKSPPAEIVSTLEQARIAGVRRVGKHIVVDLSRGSSRRSPVASRQKKQAQWIVHLGMTGRLLIAKPDVTSFPSTPTPSCGCARGGSCASWTHAASGGWRSRAKVSGAGLGAAGCGSRIVRRPVPQAQDADQERAAQPEAC